MNQYGQLLNIEVYTTMEDCNKNMAFKLQEKIKQTYIN